jgi:hypothetical protein
MRKLPKKGLGHKITFALFVAVMLVGIWYFGPHASGSQRHDSVRYRLHNGTTDSGPARLVVRHCGNAEDSWGHLHLVDFSGDTTVLRCARKGY